MPENTTRHQWNPFAGFHQVIQRIIDGRFSGQYFCAFHGCNFESTDLSKVAEHVVKHQEKM